MLENLFLQLDPDFLNNLLYPLGLLVTGGVISGILIPKYTNSQKHREISVEQKRADYQFKIKLKHELIDLFLKYRHKSFDTLTSFNIEVAYFYSKVSKNKSKKPLTVLLNFVFSDDPQKKPLVLFGDKLTKIRNNFSAYSLQYGNEFETKLKWYSDDDGDIQFRFNKIHEDTAKYSFLTVRLVQSESSDDFSNTNRELVELSDSIEDQYEQLSDALVLLEIKSIST